MDDLLEGSSLGSPVVKRIQALVPAETVRRARAHRPSLSARFDVNELVSRILAMLCRQAVAHRTGARLARGNTTNDLWWPRADTFAHAVPRPLAPVDVWRSAGVFGLRVPPQMRAVLRVIERPGGPDRVLHQLADDGVLDEVRDDVARRIAVLAVGLMDDAPPGLLRAYAAILERKSAGKQPPPLTRRDPEREGQLGSNRLTDVSAQAAFPSERPRPARKNFEVHDRYVGDKTLVFSFMPVGRPRRFSDLFRFLLHRHSEPDPACLLDGATSSDILDFDFLTSLSHDAGKSYRSFQRAIRCRKQHGAWTRCPECQREWATTGWPSSTVNMRAAEHMLTGYAPIDLSKELREARRRLLDLLGFRSKSADPQYRGSIDQSPHEFGWLPARASDRELFDLALRQRRNLLGRFTASRSPLLQERNTECGNDEISA
ncbi:hypothetical protein HCN51_56860 [Nonomuraea sp. FMUSA5-5]|uniref:Uncharacterized protein n=1 Tax=Nonomuraea composti TaxID=2720023 RepID=A0ABX1BTX1_9ACTN|nr:hypothetical protein [Nonomuraea sp. FMUSA5-5]NJP98796.1 hypothetical protein [Nonomuraea sp. FMUSA5-5]